MACGCNGGTQQQQPGNVVALGVVGGCSGASPDAAALLRAREERDILAGVLLGLALLFFVRAWLSS